MQRLVIIILAIIYMGTSTGATIHLHYCMGKMVGMKLWHSNTGKCDNCGMKKSTAFAKKCCKDEHKTVKLGNAHHKNTDNCFQFGKTVAITPVYHIEYSKAFITAAQQVFPVNNAPPRSLPIHIFHCTYRI